MKFFSLFLRIGLDDFLLNNRKLLRELVLPVENKFIELLCLPDVNLPFNQNEQKCHSLLVLIGVLGVLELEPELFASTFIDLTEHFLDDLLVSSKLLGEKLISHVVDSGCNVMLSAWSVTFLVWIISLVLFVRRDWDESGILLQVDSKIWIVVLDMVVIPKCRQ